MHNSIQLKLFSSNPVEVDITEPFKNDHLGFEKSIRRLIQIINQIETPYTLGLYSPWGSGKTSFMKMMKTQIEKENKYATFWFDSSQYENEASLLLPFLSKISEEVKKKENLFKIANKVKKSAAIIMLTGANTLLKGFTLGNIDIKDIEEIFSNYEEKFEKICDSWINQIDEIKKEFNNLVQEIMSDKTGLIFFIDFLHR